MPRSRSSRIPRYRLHKPSGRAVVTIDGKDFYLGVWRSTHSRQEYDRLITEWLTGGRRLRSSDRSTDPTITELVAQYWRFAEAYYRKDGKPTDEQNSIKAALRPLRQLYGDQVCADFGPLALKAVRQRLIDGGKSRRYINDCVARVKRMFRWAVENERVAPGVYHGLQAVAGLRHGRSEARETAPIGPVSDELVEVTIRHVSPVVAAMVRLQRCTGMRSGELVIMRGCDLDMSGGVWVYVPATHKTQHRGHKRAIFIGPKAQEIIRPFLKPDLSACLFDPREAEAIRRRERHARRKTPLTNGNRPGSNRKRQPKRVPQDHYTTDSYRRAITRGCEQAFPLPDGLTEPETEAWRHDHHWHPHQLRHNAATRLRKEFGIEAARVVLGHRSAAVTDLYTEIDHTKAAEIMAKVG